MASATPDRRRTLLSQSRAPSTGRRVRGHTQPNNNTSTSSTPSLPTYETPEAPLTADSQRQLAALLQTQSLRHLKTHLQHASEKLTESAGEINDRLCDARVRYERNKEVQRRRDAENKNENEEENHDNQEQDGENEDFRRLAETEMKVNNVTDRLEEKMRQAVDSEVRLQGLTESMAELEREEVEAQTASLRHGQAGRRVTRRGMRVGAGDEDGEEDEDAEDEDYEGTPEREARERNAVNPPSRKLDEKLNGGTARWNALSLTERYASHNAYIGFYRIVHDSKFPGDEVPPLPHSSTWFAHMEDNDNDTGHTAHTNPSQSHAQSRRTRTTSHHSARNRSASPTNSDDIAIERERISLKCPLTLLPYRDPVTSTKCPHSFEREAIIDMISRSPTTVPSSSTSGRRHRVRVVKCPVCSILLCADDLRHDAVLLRRVRRAQELSQREAEDEQFDEDNRTRRRRGGRVSGVLLTSDAVEGEDEGGVGGGEDSDVDLDLDAQEARVKSEPVVKRKRTTMEVDGGDDDEDGEESSEE